MHSPRGLTALGTLVAFILVLVVLGVFWYVSGGPERPISRAGPFLTPPGPARVDVATGRLISGRESVAEGDDLPPPRGGSDNDTGGEDTDSDNEDMPPSFSYEEHLSIERGSATQSNKDKEYFTIELSKRSPRSVVITGWVIESKKKAVKAPISLAAQPLVSGQSINQGQVVLRPGGTAYIITGRPLNGASFRVNKCSGYLNQFQSYAPKLKERCPSPEDEAASFPQKTNGANCEDFIQELSMCELYTDTLPSDIDGSCRNFVQRDLSYDGCVALHRSDADFYTDEWHIYLSRDQELWENAHDDIRVLDESGRLVGSVSY